MDNHKFQGIFSKKDQLFSFSVSAYLSVHSSMLIRVRESGNDNHYFISFHSLIYYEGGMGWQGSGFYRGSDEELKMFIKKLYPHYDESRINAFTEDFSLLKSDVYENESVKLITYDAERHDNVPESFREVVGSITW